MKNIRSENNSGFDYRLFIITIFLLATLGLLFNFSNCKIEMQSMNDTLIGADPGSGETKDVILLSKWTGKLKYKDIIVFDHASNPDPLIKRVIATAGETIRFALSPSGEVTLEKKAGNGVWRAIDESSYIKDGRMTEFSEKIFEFVKPKGSYYTGSPDYAALTVPDDKLFVMGDNRAVSSDSRAFGYIDASAVSGKMVGPKTLGKDFPYYKNALLAVNFFAILLYIFFGMIEAPNSLRDSLFCFD